MQRQRFIQGIVAVLTGLALLARQQAYAVGTDRGTWFFDVDHPVGSANIVGNVASENFVIGQFQKHNIARNYQSFFAPVPPPAASDIAAWHTRLNAASITPMLLLSDASATADPNFFQDQLIDFNNGRPANERYAGVKLDLEPQGSAAWSSGTPTDRRDLLLDLANTYAAIRAQLDAGGEAGTPIYADIPAWFDVTGATIGWGEDTPLTPEQERDQWFSDIAGDLDGITLMAFGTPFFSVIEANVNWEINNFGADVRIGLEASVGPAKTFPDFPSLMELAVEIEDFYDAPLNNPSGHSIGIDFQDFAQLFDAALPEPETALLGFMGIGALLARLRRRRVA